MSDDALKTAYRQSLSADGAHLTEAEWEQLTCGELDADARERMHAHIIACSRCTEIRQSLDELREEAQTFDPGAQVPPRVIAKPWWFAVSGLAAAAAIVIIVVMNRPTLEPREATRAASSSVVVSVTTPQRDAILEARRFAWESVPAADTYEVRVSAVDGGAVWSSRVAAAEAALPRDLTLQTGQYYVQITALKEGATVGVSALVPFHTK